MYIHMMYKHMYVCRKYYLHICIKTNIFIKGMNILQPVTGFLSFGNCHLKHSADYFWWSMTDAYWVWTVCCKRQLDHLASEDSECWSWTWGDLTVYDRKALPCTGGWSACQDLYSHRVHCFAKMLSHHIITFVYLWLQRPVSVLNRQGIYICCLSQLILIKRFTVHIDWKERWILATCGWDLKWMFNLSSEIKQNVRRILVCGLLYYCEVISRMSGRFSHAFSICMSDAELLI